MLLIFYKISTTKLSMNVLNVISESSTLIVGLEYTKSFLKVDFNEDDEYIMKLIKTATKQCEMSIARTIVGKTYLYSLYNPRKSYIFLPYPPIQEVNLVTIMSRFGNESFISDYTFDSIGGIINITTGFNNIYRLDINYTAGQSVINEDIIQAILMHVARMYGDKSGYSPVPKNSMNIYKQYKRIRI